MHNIAFHFTKIQDIVTEIYFKIRRKNALSRITARISLLLKPRLMRN